MAADLAGAHQKTLGADKNYDTKGFVAEMRRIGVTPHMAQNTARRGIEMVFGWLKAFGGLRQFKLRCQEMLEAASAARAASRGVV